MAGRDFVQLPGPTNIPDSILEAFRRPVVDYGTAEFMAFVDQVWDELTEMFGSYRVTAYPSVGHGAWEATLVNLLEPGQRFVLPQAGLFSMRWSDMAEAMGFAPVRMPVDQRCAPDPSAIYELLAADTNHELAGVFVAHCETATGTLADLAAIREAIDAADHPGLFVVDAIASFATDPVPMAELGIDVVIAASQKGLMMPPGLSFAALSEKAVQHNATVTTPRFFWSWTERIDPDFLYQRFCGTPPIQHLFALRASVDHIAAQGGIDAVTDRHRRFATATQAAVEAWGAPFELNVIDPAQRAAALTCVLAEGIDVGALLTHAREKYHVLVSGAMVDMAGRAFRIGHLGDLNEPMLLGALAGFECAMRDLAIAHQSGIEAATAALTHS